MGAGLVRNFYAAQHPGNFVLPRLLVKQTHLDHNSIHFFFSDLKMGKTLRCDLCEMCDTQYLPTLSEQSELCPMRKPTMPLKSFLAILIILA